MTTRTTIIGVDCATLPKKMGLAHAAHDASGTHLLDAVRGDVAVGPARWIADRVIASDRVLIALDAPLGWPAPLGAGLAHHSAGDPLLVDANNLFRRYTDQEIKRRIGKQPLDVGADRIARTAHAALELLAVVRELTRLPIPLAWEPGFAERAAAIEVYPAATLKSLKLASSGYKTAKDRDQRATMLMGLRDHLELGSYYPALVDNADVMDAAVCAVAGADFLAGRAVPPRNLDMAVVEGWIWVRTNQRG